jgi:SdrD B-like domain/Secretion system C-terminal sorting domain
MKTISTVLVAILMIAINVTTQAQISGTVFRDFNGSGIKENTATFNETFVAGVTIKAFNSNNVQIGATKTTDALGAYTFTAGEIPATTKVRIEFSGLGLGDFSSTNGTGNGTNVQFATAPSTTTSFAVNAPDDYWNNTANPDPSLMIVNLHRGTNDGTYAGRNTLLRINNTSTGPNVPTNSSQVTIDTGQTIAARRTMTHIQTGSVFGLAYQKKYQRYFTSAELKRNSGLGPKGMGGIYFADKSGVNWVYSGGFTLQGVTPSNGGAALDFGTVTRVASPVTNDNYISNQGSFTLSTGSDGRDNDAFAKVGTMAYGDIEGDPSSDKIYMINAFQKSLIVFNATATSGTLNNATTATLAPFTNAYVLSTLPGYPAPTGAGNNMRPYAVKIYKGKGYIGVVSDAMATQAIADLKGYILQFDPNNIAAGFTTVVTINYNLYSAGYFKPWVSTWAQAVTGNGGTVPRNYAQPIISSIEFNEDGSMDIGMRDRWGSMTGSFEYPATAGASTVPSHSQAATGGDLLHACFVGGVWVLEGTAGSCVQPLTNGGLDTDNLGNQTSYNNTGKEWYGDRVGDGGNEDEEGGVTKLMGTGIIVSSVLDPMPSGGNSAAVDGGGNGIYWSTQGIKWNSNTSGLKTQITRTQSGATVDKSNGMGDLEFAVDPQPLQIGNRIWNDLNGNGIQDANETTSPVAAGTPVTLRSPGVDGIYGNADDQTTTTTTDATGNYYFSALAAADNRKPAAWTGVGNTILPGYDYRIEFAIPVGFQLTKTDAATNSVDNIDNDAVLNGTNAFVTFNTGNTNHNFDIGFKNLASLGNRVWLDEGAGGGTRSNGVQDGTEPGVAGVAVNLFQNGADGFPNTADDVLVASTITDAFGIYNFENLQPTDQTSAATIAATSYFIRITPPANYATTVQTNGTDDNNTTGASTTGSDVDLLGQSYSINLSAGENNPNIDAGLIFKAQVLPNSIGDKVWYDADGNGINANNAAEPGVAGVTVTLYDDLTGNIVAITTTDANGNYLFNNLPANTNYKVGFSAPAGTVLTTGGVLDLSNTSTNSDPSPTTGLTSTINTSAAGTQITGVDAGLKNDPKGAIGDFVWNDNGIDANGVYNPANRNNGIQDPGEPGVPGVTMTLYNLGPDGIRGNADDGPTLTTKTDANGYYVFPNLDPSKYIVAATPISGYALSPKDVTAGNPGGNTKDNDFGAGTGFFAGSYVSSVVELKPIGGGVTRDMTIDLGIYNSTTNLNSLGDKVWNDVNKDGLQTAGEAGVPNITVRLLNGAGTAVNNPATGKPYVVVTDAAGMYRFVDLPDGNYIVEFANLPAGYSFTSQDKDAANQGAPGSGTDGTTDSDAKTTTGRTDVIAIDPTSTNPVSINILTVDAGITQGISAGTASLGNRVWYDNGRDATGAIITGNRNNGLQDVGELGVNNVKVELLDAAGVAAVNVPGTSVPYVIYTNALGEYLFTGLPAGDYTVRFSNLPAGFTSSLLNAGTPVNSNDDKDSDASFTGTSTTTTTATTAVYTLQTGEDNLTVDMGIVPLPATGGAVNAANNSLGNFVWYDNGRDASGVLVPANASNGKQDLGEPGVPGITVTLYTNGADGLPGTADDVRVGVTTTDNNGAYNFVGLPDGNYNVGFTNLPAGFSFTDKDKAGSTAADGSDANTASGRTATYALDPLSASATAVNEITVDAGLVSTRAALGNQVWLDTDGDGLLNNGEKGVSGVTVTLYDDATNAGLASTITDADGKYYFGNLLPGDYKVGFSTIPSNLSFTKQTTAGVADNNTNNNSDADPATGLTTKITLIAGETDLTIDAGLKPDNFASVGDLVWNDLDALGTKSLTEPGVPGILVTLYDATTNLPVGTAITDGNGKYLISKIAVAAAGTSFYIIFSNLPTSAQFTAQTDNVTPGDLTNGSDANTATGRTSNFTLTPSQYLQTVDAGIQNVQVLPIKITSFSAVPKGSQVNLQWMVSEQTNVATYEVEASADGRTFASIATLASNGNQAATYDAVHTTPTAGINYYRIKTIEKDGVISYSDIRKVNFGKGGDVIIYPNPVSTGVINITLTGNMIGKSATVSILSMDGKLISQQQIANTNQTETIDVSRLSNGSYVVRLITESEVINRTIQVIR